MTGGKQRAVGLPPDVVGMERQVDHVFLHRRLPARQPHHLTGGPEVYVEPFPVSRDFNAVGPLGLAPRHDLEALARAPLENLAGIRPALAGAWPAAVGVCGDESATRNRAHRIERGGRWRDGAAHPREGWRLGAGVDFEDLNRLPKTVMHH